MTVFRLLYGKTHDKWELAETPFLPLQQTFPVFRLLYGKTHDKWELAETPLLPLQPTFPVAVTFDDFPQGLGQGTMVTFPSFPKAMVALICHVFGLN